MNKHTKESAMKTHYLSSILPFNPTLPFEEQITKTKDFYKPQQFIWNNPHRTSKRMYQYYHKFNETYQKQVKPHVDKLQQRDRMESQKQRILKLTNMRNQTRHKFYSRQKMRVDLQMKAGSRLRQHSTLEVIDGSKTATNFPYMKNTLENKPMSNRKLSLKQKDGPIAIHNFSIPEKTFMSGLEQYDQNLNDIKKMVSEQIYQNHNKIRTQFSKRKQNNEQTISRIKNSGVRLTPKD